MHLSERVAFAYFAYLVVTALLTPAWPARTQALARGVSAAAAVWLVSRLPETGALALVRQWMPAAYLLAGYWLSGLFFVRPMDATQDWCLALDRRVFGALRIPVLVERAPRIVLEALEGAYLTCFLLVPAGMIVIAAVAPPAALDDGWALVLLAEFGAFGMLPWIQTLPPRALEPPGTMDRRPLVMRRLNMAMVRETSIQVNTLPSGHVAGSLATAIAVWGAAPAAGALVLILSLLIAAGAVVGRYHYTIDAIGGVALALAASAAVSAWG